MNNKKIIGFSISALSLVLGAVIYLFFREPPFIFYKVLGREFVLTASDFSAGKYISTYLPNWVLYNLPDMLWMLSLMIMIITIWNLKISKASIFWIIVCIITGLTFEFLQYFSFVPGVFDFYDILFIILGCLLPFLIFSKNFIYEKKYFT